MESNYRVIISVIGKPLTFIDKREWEKRPTREALADLTQSYAAADQLLELRWVIVNGVFYKFEKYKQGGWG